MKLRLAILFFLAAFSLRAQGFRFESQVSQAVSIPGISPTLITIPTGSQISVCSYPASAVPCTKKATTYTSIALGTSCPTSTQLVLPGPSSCAANTDLPGNWGVWVTSGLTYSYMVTLRGANVGPYSFTAGGAGGGGSPAAPFTALQLSNSGIFGASGLLDNGTLVQFNRDAQFKGPNPFIDCRAYGCRGVTSNVAPAVPGVTCTTNGTTAVTLSIASTFQNGDGFVCYGAGPNNTMSPPSTPTVTPSNAASLTGSLLDVASATGSTTYSYKIAACYRGGCTAASSAGTTTTGQASLGEQTTTFSSVSMLGNIITVQTSAAHSMPIGCTTCPLIVVSGVTQTTSLSPNPYNGFFVVSTVPDSKHFTYQVNSNTLNGASLLATGGSAVYYNSNHITWSAATGAVNGAVYLIWETAPTPGLIGISWPQNSALAGDTTYLAFDDFGSPVTSLPNPPFWAPLSPPASATNQMLATTIVSGAGTKSIVVANAATNTVTTQTALFDDGVPLLNAAAAAGGLKNVKIPYGGSYVINSPVTMPANSSILQDGSVYLNETVNITSSSWRGTTESGCLTSFAFATHPCLTINKAYPGFYATNSPANLYSLTLQENSANGATMVLYDLVSAIPAVTTKDVSFVINNGGTDYSNMGMVLRGTHTASGAVSYFENDLFSTSQNGNLIASTPALYVDNGANLHFNQTFLSGKGALLRPTVSGSYLEVDQVYSQGNYLPYFSFTNALGGGTAAINFKVDNVIYDTTFLPLGANLGGLIVFFDGRIATSTSGSSPVLTGVPTTISNEGLSQNTNTDYAQNQTTFDGTFFNNVTNGVGSVGQHVFDRSVVVSPAFAAFGEDQLSSPPTCVTNTAGPSYTLSGTWTFKYAFIYPNGGTGNTSPASRSCTANGTSQQIVVTLPAAPLVVGATGAFIYASSGGSYGLIGNLTPTTTAQTYTFTAAFVSGSIPNGSGSGPAGFQGNTAWARYLYGSNLFLPQAPANSFVIAQGNSAATFNTPPAVNGQYNCGYNVTASTVVTPTCTQVGMKGRALTGAASTDTVLFSDNNANIDHDIAGSASVNETLPTARMLTNPSFVYKYSNHSTHIDTITPTAWTIQQGTAAAEASISVNPGVYCVIKVDPNSSTNWLADCAASSSGVIGLVANQDFAGRTTAIGSTILSSSRANGAYRISAALNCTVAASATVFLTVAWTDTSSTALISNTGTANCSVLGNNSYVYLGMLTLNVKSGTNITFSTTITGSPTYDLRIAAEGAW